MFNLGAVSEAIAAAFPDQEAIVFRDRRITFGQLNERGKRRFERQMQIAEHCRQGQERRCRCRRLERAHREAEQQLAWPDAGPARRLERAHGAPSGKDG